MIKEKLIIDIENRKVVGFCRAKNVKRQMKKLKDVIL